MLPPPKPCIGSPNLQDTRDPVQLLLPYAAYCIVYTISSSLVPSHKRNPSRQDETEGIPNFHIRNQHSSTQKLRIFLFFSFRLQFQPATSRVKISPYVAQNKVSTGMHFPTKTCRFNKPMKNNSSANQLLSWHLPVLRGTRVRFPQRKNEKSYFTTRHYSSLLHTLQKGN